MNLCNDVEWRCRVDVPAGKQLSRCIYIKSAIGGARRQRERERNKCACSSSKTRTGTLVCVRVTMRTLSRMTVCADFHLCTNTAGISFISQRSQHQLWRLCRWLSLSIWAVSPVCFAPAAIQIQFRSAASSSLRRRRREREREKRARGTAACIAIGINQTTSSSSSSSSPGKRTFWSPLLNQGPFHFPYIFPFPPVSCVPFLIFIFKSSTFLVLHLSFVPMYIYIFDNR